MIQNKQPTLLKGALLVAGTSIGGGVLALPVLTASAGFLPSVVLYVACWLLMAGTGLLFLEVSQWMRGEANILSMASYTLGSPGRWVAWVVYLFLFYCLTIAYMVGCGGIVGQLLPQDLPEWAGVGIFVACFTPLIWMTTCLAARLNLLLVIGLVTSYLAFVWQGWDRVEGARLLAADWGQWSAVLPIAFTSFAYQGIIPTLARYLDHREKTLRLSILWGTCIPLVIYIIWEALILGIIPLEGQEGLLAAGERGENAAYALRFFLSGSWLYWFGQSFAFFALITSFLGVSLGLRDFLSDGLQIENRGFARKSALVILTLFFPLLFALFHPHSFLTALEYAGGIGCALLLGLLPIAMCWSGRYQKGFLFNQQLPGGRWMLSGLALFVFIELGYECVHLFN